LPENRAAAAVIDLWIIAPAGAFGRYLRASTS